jgi:biotin carboxyl carrier protein
MTFEIGLDGTQRTVSIEPAGEGRFRVVIDGQPHFVLAERSGEYGLSMIFQGPGAGGHRLPGASWELQIAPGTAHDELLVGIGGRTVAVSVNGRRRRRASSDHAGHSAGEQSVTAPMPGRVVRVLVGPGDEVSARQGVVVVEAMKMENELRSPKAGRIKNVAVTPGMSVEAGRVLVVVE